MNRFFRVLVGLIAVLSIALFGASPARASESQCTGGHACMWGENTYSGCFVQYSGDRDSFGSWSTCSASANNGANSVKNEGNSCNVVYFDATNRTGVGILFNREVDGFNYRDPNLSNGGGIGFGGAVAGQNWQDRISSLDFCR